MAKLRVYELAQELGVDSRQVMAALEAIGEFIRSASSTVEPAAAQVVREKLRRQPSVEEVHVSERHPARDIMSVTTRAAWHVPQPVRPLTRPRRTIALRNLAPLERVVARHRRYEVRIPEHDVESIRAEARAWAKENGSPTRKRRDGLRCE
jgi:hypothetical protein